MDVNLTDLLHGGMRRIQAYITLIACLSFLALCLSLFLSVKTLHGGGSGCSFII